MSRISSPVEPFLRFLLISKRICIYLDSDSPLAASRLSLAARELVTRAHTSMAANVNG